MNIARNLTQLNKKHRTGAATVEFAITLPLLITLCLTTVDFGRYSYSAIALDNAVRIAAERGATRQFTDHTYVDWHDDVIDRVFQETNHISANDISDLQVTVSTTPTGNSLYRVNVTADCAFKTVIDWPMLPNPLIMRREISMRQYR